MAGGRPRSAGRWDPRRAEPRVAAGGRRPGHGREFCANTPVTSPVEGKITLFGLISGTSSVNGLRRSATAAARRSERDRLCGLAERWHPGGQRRRLGWPGADYGERLEPGVVTGRHQAGI